MKLFFLTISNHIKRLPVRETFVCKFTMKSPLWRYSRVSSALALLTSWAGYPKCQFCCGGCSGHCRLFMSIQVLHALHAKTNSLTVMTTKNIFRHCLLSPQWGSMEDKYHILLRITKIFWYLQWYKYYQFDLFIPIW